MYVSSVVSNSWWPLYQAPLSRLLCPRILEWVAISSPRGSSWLSDWTPISSGSCTGRQILYHWANWKVNCRVSLSKEACFQFTVAHSWISHVWFFVTPGTVGSSVHGILQARMLEWVAIPFTRGSSQPRDWLRSPALQADSLPSETPGEPKFSLTWSQGPSLDGLSLWLTQDLGHVRSLMPHSPATTPPFLSDMQFPAWHPDTPTPGQSLASHTTCPPRCASLPTPDGASCYSSLHKHRPLPPGSRSPPCSPGHHHSWRWIFLSSSTRICDSIHISWQIYCFKSVHLLSCIYSLAEWWSAWCQQRQNLPSSLLSLFQHPLS